MSKKKSVKKKTSKKSVSKIRKSKSSARRKKDIHVEKVLVENFVALQKVMANLSTKFDNLSGQISKLLELFEISAKTLVQKDFELGGKDSKKMLEKIDNLLEQNKVIARGLTLLHEPETKQMTPSNIPQQIPQTNSRTNTLQTTQTLPIQQPPQQMQKPPAPLFSQMAKEEDSLNQNINEYQKSRDIDESSNVNFDIGRQKAEEKKNEFGI